MTERATPGELRLQSISKTYPHGRVAAVVEADLRVQPGEIVCILGPNGAGKTTLSKIVCGLVLADQGECTLGGRPLGDNAFTRESVGAVLEGSRNVYNYLTTAANLRYFGRLNRVAKDVLERRIDQYLSLFDLTDKKDTLVRELSRGMQQKVAILVALIKDPQVLILDEPTLGLDIASARKMVEELRVLAAQQGKVVLITTHDIALIERLRGRVVFLREGQILLDTTMTDLQRQAAVHDFVATYAPPIRGEAERSGSVTEVWEEDGQLCAAVASEATLAELQEIGDLLSVKPRESGFEDLYRRVVEGDRS